jgi:hypothetical protein
MSLTNRVFKRVINFYSFLQTANCQLPTFFSLQRILFFLTLSAFVTLSKGQGDTTKGLAEEQDSLLIRHLLEKNPARFKLFLDHPNTFKIQIIYTQVDRDKNNTPSFHTYTYGLDPKKYFYCASLVKLPCSALALEKLNELEQPGLTKESRMFTDSMAPCQRKVIADSSSRNGYPSLAHYIRRMLLISDNEAYSRVYEFLGQEYIHTRLQQKGYPDAFIINRFDSRCNASDNTCTNPVDFFSETGQILYHQPAANCSKPASHPLGNVKAGRAYIDAKGKTIKGPKDFSSSNYLNLSDVTTMLRSIVFPNTLDPAQRFNISEEDRKFLLRYLSMLPRESDYPRYGPKDYYDSYKKYLFWGDSRQPIQQDSMRIFNVVGQSYGFTADVAYICDFKNKVEFMLSAVIYTNKDDVMNTGRYQINTQALPWFSELGKTIYNHDRSRKRNTKPDLNEFLFSY